MTTVELPFRATTGQACDWPAQQTGTRWALARMIEAKSKAVWNPVTLALGLNDAYRVPLPHLKRAFNAHDFLHPWAAEWNHTLALLGK
ncbi:MAG: hypothetical protein Q8Q81_04815 [Oxalobacteraceae bacterium]|nr:hypothetical protein [Oxalobacteraceae bacterium]